VVGSLGLEAVLPAGVVCCQVLIAKVCEKSKNWRRQADIRNTVSPTTPPAEMKRKPTVANFANAG